MMKTHDIKGSDCNCTRTQNYLVRKQTLNHLAKLAVLDKTLCIFRKQLKCLSCSFC